MNLPKTVQTSKRLILILIGLIVLGFVGGVWLWSKIQVGREPCGWLDLAFKQSGCLRILEGHENVVWSVAFSPNGTTLASGGLDNTARLWRVSDGAILRTLGHEDYILSLAFSPDGQTLATGSNDHTVRLWRVNDGTLLQTLTGHLGQVNSLAFSPDGTKLASGSSDATIRIWNARDGTLLQTLTGHMDGVNRVAFSSDGSLLASGGWGLDTIVRLWRVSDGTLLRMLEKHPADIISLAFSPDSKVLVSGSNDGTLRLEQVSDGTLLQTQELSQLQSLALSPDGTSLAVGMRTSNTLQLWQIDEKRLIRTFQGRADWANQVSGLAFSPEGNLLASTYGRQIWLWSVR